MEIKCVIYIFSCYNETYNKDLNISIPKALQTMFLTEWGEKIRVGKSFKMLLTAEQCTVVNTTCPI